MVKYWRSLRWDCCLIISGGTFYYPVKNRYFYIKRLFFTNWTVVKILFFLCKSLPFYKNNFVKKLVFCKIYFCEKAAFLWNPAFLHINFREKRASCSSFRPFDKLFYRRQAVFYNMVRTLLNCSFLALLKLYVIRFPASHVHVPVYPLLWGF